MFRWYSCARSSCAIEQQERRTNFTRSQVPTGHRIVAKLTKPGRMYAAVSKAATAPNLQATTRTILKTSKNQKPTNAALIGIWSN
jgi:hypothetical protein